MDTAFRRAVAEARRHGDLYFACLLPEDRILEAFGKARSLWQGWIYTPAVTVWVFLSQCGWFDIALPRQRGAHIVVRKHQLRSTDFRRGWRLGHDDHLVQWCKPQRPTWMSKEQYATLPKFLTVRSARACGAERISDSGVDRRHDLA